MSVDLVYRQPDEIISDRLTYATYVEELLERLPGAYDLVRTNLKKAAERRKRNYDLRVHPKEYLVGMWVWIFSPLQFSGHSQKWMKGFGGPYMIVQRYGPVNFSLQKSPKSKAFTAHIDKLKRFLTRT